MKQLLTVLLGIILLLVVAVILGRCTSDRDTASKALPQPADSALATPTPDATVVAGGSAPLTKITLVGPASVQLGRESEAVSVKISGVQQLGELVLEIATGAPNLTVIDNDTQTPGIQVAPAALSEGATLQQLEVDTAGILRYKVQNLKLESPDGQNLLLFQVQGASLGIAGIVVQQASAKAPDGAAITVDKGLVLNIPVQSPTPPPTPASSAPPTPTPTPPASSAVPIWAPGAIQPGIYYRIQRGQNLFRLGQTFKVSVEDLAQANGITDVRQIPTGMLLRIPVPSPKGQAAYLVSTGETLYGIAGSLGMTVEQIAHLNAIAPPYHLTIGQYLMLIP